MIFIFLILLLILFVSIIHFRQKWTSRRIEKWRRSLDLDVHLAVLQNLYAEVDGFALSQKARIGRDAPEYVYGEVDLESFIALLTRFRPDKNTVFYDLGSGTGKTALALAMVFNVGKSCGIELFSNLYQSAELQLKRLGALPKYKMASKTIQFQHGDFMDFSLSDATLVFINASAFLGDYWMKISEHLEQLPKGTIVLCTSKKLHSTQYQVIYTSPIKTSWGVVQVYAHSRQVK